MGESVTHVSSRRAVHAMSLTQVEACLGGLVVLVLVLAVVVVEEGVAVFSPPTQPHPSVLLMAASWNVV